MLRFLAAVADAGIEIASDRIVEADFTQSGAYAATTQLLETQPDAIFCASDTMALGALRAIEDAGLRCPEDIALVSFDGLVDADQTAPSLTTVAQPVRRTGEEAVKLLLEVLEQEPETPTRRVLPTELLIRGSCGCSSG